MGVKAVDGNFFPTGILGATVLKGTSLEPEMGARGPRMWEFGRGHGVVNAIGLENPGVEWFCETLLKERFEKQNPLVPVFMNVFGFKASEYPKVIERVLKTLKELKITITQPKYFAGFELNVSCPNVEKGGLEISADLSLLKKVVTESIEAAQGFPVLLKLGANETPESLLEKMRLLDKAGLWGFTLTNTLPVVVPEKNYLGRETGELSGTPLFLKNLKLVDVARKHLNNISDAKTQIVGCGGVVGKAEAQAYLERGADFVQVGSFLCHPKMRSSFF